MCGVVICGCMDLIIKLGRVGRYVWNFWGLTSHPDGEGDDEVFGLGYGGEGG